MNRSFLVTDLLDSGWQVGCYSSRETTVRWDVYEGWHRQRRLC